MKRITLNTHNYMEEEKKKCGRPKGLPKYGGRVKGTPNKITKDIREKLAEITSKYYNSELFVNDIAALEPKDRVAVMEKLTNYVAPKMQSTTVDANIEAKKTIEDRLLALSSGSKE